MNASIGNSRRCYLSHKFKRDRETSVTSFLVNQYREVVIPPKENFLFQNMCVCVCKVQTFITSKITAVESIWVIWAQKRFNCKICQG